MLSANFKPKRTAAAGIARFPCDSTAFLSILSTSRMVVKPVRITTRTSKHRTTVVCSDYSASRAMRWKSIRSTVNLTVTGFVVVSHLLRSFQNLWLCLRAHCLPLLLMWCSCWWERRQAYVVSRKANKRTSEADEIFPHDRLSVFFGLPSRISVMFVGFSSFCSGLIRYFSKLVTRQFISTR